MKAKPGPPQLEQAIQDKILKLIGYGISTAAICERFGITKSVVYRVKYRASMGGVRKYYPPRAK